jgi:hypothetical protein
MNRSQIYLEFQPLVNQGAVRLLDGQENLVSDAGMHPVLLQRQSVATHLARLLDQIGLERVARKVDSLEAYRARFQQEEEVDGQQVKDANQAQEPQDQPTAPPGA